MLRWKQDEQQISLWADHISQKEQTMQQNRLRLTPLGKTHLQGISWKMLRWKPDKHRKTLWENRISNRTK